MKKALLSFLMLIMLTPSLACAMPSCSDGQKTVSTAQQPCAEHHSGPGDDKGGDTLNLLIDCMGVDLQTADTPADLKKPDLKTAVLVLMPVDDVMVSRWSPDVNTRGSPPDGLWRSRTQPPLLLTTQRFRI